MAIDQTQIQLFIDQLRPAVEATAQALSTTADQLWTIGMMKQYVDGIFSLIVAAAMIPLIGLTIWHGKKIWPWAEDTYSEPIYIIHGLVVIGAVLAFFACLYGGLLHVIVPQYTLIMEIVGKINM